MNIISQRRGGSVHINSIDINEYNFNQKNEKILNWMNKNSKNKEKLNEINSLIKYLYLNWNYNNN